MTMICTEKLTRSFADVDFLKKEDAEIYLYCPLEPYPSEKNMASCLHWVRAK